MIKSLISNKDIPIKVTMASDIVAPMTHNDCIVELDNSRCNKAITGVRLALIRTITTYMDKFYPVEDVIATATSKGGPAN